MCYRTTCYKCGKPTWTGCGMHIEAVLHGIPMSKRCNCGKSYMHIPKDSYERYYASPASSRKIDYAYETRRAPVSIGPAPRTRTYREYYDQSGDSDSDYEPQPASRTRTFKETYAMPATKTTTIRTIRPQYAQPQAPVRQQFQIGSYNEPSSMTRMMRRDPSFDEFPHPNTVLSRRAFNVPITYVTQPLQQPTMKKYVVTNGGFLKPSSSGWTLM